jgi:hypothetical protein
LGLAAGIPGTRERGLLPDIRCYTFQTPIPPHRAVYLRIPAMTSKPLLLIGLAILALCSCKKSSPAASPSGADSAKALAPSHNPDSAFVDVTDSVLSRFPEIRSLFAKESLELVRILQPKDTSDEAIRKDRYLARIAFKVNVPSTAKRRSLKQFDTFLWTLASTLGKSSNISLMDTSNTPFARLALRDGDLKMYVATDPTAWFEPPAVQLFASGMDRFRKSLPEVQPATEDESDPQRIEYPSIGILDINGRVYYQFQVVYVDEYSAGYSYPRSCFLIDALDGTRWEQPFIGVMEGAIVAMKGEGKNRRFLHAATDTTGKSWRLVNVSPRSERNSTSIWQYRPSDHRLQHIDLDSLKLIEEMQVDTAGFGGSLVRLFEGLVEPDTVLSRFALIRRQDSYVVVRNRGLAPFDAWWPVPDTTHVEYLEVTKDSIDGPTELSITLLSKQYPVAQQTWIPLSKQGHE